MDLQPLNDFDPGGSSLSPVSPSFLFNNNNSNNTNIKLKTPKNISLPSCFSPLHFSPDVEASDYLISLATLNVRGLSISSKFDSLMQDFALKNLSIVGLQETRLSEASGSSLSRSFLSAFPYKYKSYWSFDPADPCAGVGFILRDFVSSYVQRIQSYGGRCIVLDLFFPCRKLRLVNVYNHQLTDFTSKGLALSKFIISQLKDARLNGFRVLILGDLNLDPHAYHHTLESGRSVPKAFAILDFLVQSDFTDLFPLNSVGQEFATRYDNVRPTSRIDQIWQSSSFLMDEYMSSQVWQPPSSLLNSAYGFTLDHRCVIAYYSRSLFMGSLPLHRVKQKGLWRTVYDYASASTEQWSAFTDYIDSHLASNSLHAFVALESPLDSSKIMANSTWNVFKDTLLAAAADCLPSRKVSSESFHHSSHTSESLLRIKRHLRILNQVFAFLTRLIAKPSDSASRLDLAKVQSAWSSSSDSVDDLYSSLRMVNKVYDDFIALRDIPKILPIPINLPLLVQL